jgi:hypothetical protein
MKASHLTYSTAWGMWRQRVRDDVEESGRGLTEILRRFPEETEENNKRSVGIVRVQPDTRTKDLMNRRQTLIYS